MKNIIPIIMIMALCACSESSSDLTEQNPKISQELMQRRQAYRQRKLNECKTETIERAMVYVDSLIAARISYQFSDSIIFPPKPEKPASKNPILIEDFEKAKPIRDR